MHLFFRFEKAETAHCFFYEQQPKNGLKKSLNIFIQNLVFTPKNQKPIPLNVLHRQTQTYYLW